MRIKSSDLYLIMAAVSAVLCFIPLTQGNDKLMFWTGMWGLLILSNIMRLDEKYGGKK